MELQIHNNSKEAGKAAAKLCAEHLNEAIKQKGTAVLLLSTGASQYDFFDNIIKENVDWSKVEMFHLDEYIGLGDMHKASFKKYLCERFADKIKLKKAFFVNGKGDIAKNIEELSTQIKARTVDVGMIGIGENAHIAFNDPPADFDDTAAYKVVTLDEKCKAQQIREGWFTKEETEGLQAITMTCRQIMQCKKIVSLVPYAVKAEAVKNTLESSLTPQVPATLLKEHSDWTLICDSESASSLNKDIIEKYSVR